jgi:mono/diheme cytochrome c family protein
MNRPILLLLAVPAIVFGQSSTALVGNMANGRTLFTKFGCYQCHGYAGQGGLAGAPLIPVGFNAQGLIRYVRRPAGEMPAYAESAMSDQDLTDVYVYIKSLPTPRAVKDIPLLKEMKDRR